MADKESIRYANLGYRKSKCPICGKVFDRSSEWIYKRGGKRQTLWFCRYNCMRQYDKDHEKRIYHSVGRSVGRSEGR